MPLPVRDSDATGDSAKVKTQIYLTKRQRSSAMRLARERGTSVAHILREALDRFLQKEEQPQSELRQLIGLASSRRPNRGATDHNEIIYG